MITTSVYRIADKIKTFNKFGYTGNGKITRLSLSSEELEAREEVCKRCRELGMQIQTDDMANIYATLKGNIFNSSIIIGAHLDTKKESEVSNVAIGIIAALEVIETIVKGNIHHNHSITIAIFTNTEDDRFYPKRMSSGVISGKFEKSMMLDSIDSDGITFKEALEASGYMGTADNRLNSEKYMAFIELSMEQETILEKEDADIGVIEYTCDKVNYYSKFVESIEKSIRGYRYKERRLYNDLEYNSQFIANIVPTAMIVVPGGKNKENFENIWKGANVLLQTILYVDKYK